MALVLIVVDEPDTLLLLRRIVVAAGHRAALAADADTALERLSALAVDVVILDVMMPVLDGWTVLAALAGRFDAPPALVLSGRARPIDRERAERLGVAGWLAVPVIASEVDRAVARALGLKLDVGV